MRKKAMVLLVMAVEMLALSAGPVFAEVSTFRDETVLSNGDTVVTKAVVTPSGKINCNAHVRTVEHEGGGAAKHFERQSPTIRHAIGGGEFIEITIGPTTTKGVHTPSGNVNVSCHGRVLEE